MILQSCGDKHHTRTYKLPKYQVPPPNQTLKKSSPLLRWEKPKDWIPSTGSTMRLASFEVPYTGDKGDLSVIQLAGTGGGLEPNINRWRRQLGLEPQSLIEIEKDLKNTNGKLGEYKMIKIVNNSNNSAFLAAIIPIGNKTLFVKLAANPSGIQEIISDFESFCSSIYYSN